MLLYSVHLVLLTNVLLDTKLQLLAFHLLYFLIIEFVPVTSTSILYMGDVVAGVGTDAPMNQHRTQFINTLLVWRNSKSNTQNCQRVYFSSTKNIYCSLEIRCIIRKQCIA